MFMDEQEWQEFCANQENRAEISSLISTGAVLRILCKSGVRTLDLGAAEDPPWRGQWHLGLLWHIPGFQLLFYPEGAQLQTPKLCKANQSDTGAGNFQSAPGATRNVSMGAASGFFANTKCRGRGLHGYSWRHSFKLSALLLTGKKSLNQDMLRWVRHFGCSSCHTQGKSAQPSPASPFSSILTKQEQTQTWQMIGP